MKKISIRLTKDQYNFLSLLEKKGIDKSSAIRLCIDLIRLASENNLINELFKKLTKKLNNRKFK